MEYRIRPRGVCAKEMMVEVDEQGVVQELKVMGGCHGNLQGIAQLAKGRPAEEIIALLKGVKCGVKGTSCPDQISKALQKALAE